MGLRFDPVGGGQFKQLVKQVIEAERAPIKQLETRKAREDAKIKLFQDFKNKFSGIQKSIDEIATMKRLREFKVDLGDGTNQMSITIDKEKAEPGSYEIEIDKLARRSSVITNGFVDPDEKALGIGFIVMNMPDGETKEVFVDSDASSLNGVAKAINAQSESPVQASVIRDAKEPDAPWKLLLTAKKDGAEQNIEFPELYFLDGDEDIYINDDHASGNLQLKLDGFEVEMSSNHVNDFLPGVNAHFKQAKPDQPFFLTITEDHQKVAGKIKTVVDQVNSIFDFIYKQNAIDEKTDTRTTFAGDTSLQTIEYRLRNLLHEGFPVKVSEESEEYRIMFLSDLGIEFGKNGQLSIKEEKLQKTLEKDYMGASEAITGEHGFATQLREVFAVYTRPGNGLLATREQGLRRRMTELDRQIENKERLAERRAQAVTEQFSRLQGNLANMQRQQSQLSATLGGGGGNPISQLLGG